MGAGRGTATDTNAEDYAAGSYAYVPTGANTALLTNVDIGMLSALGTTNVTSLGLMFTSATTANYAWTNDSGTGTGTLTLSTVSNLVPATLAGRTVTLYNNNRASVVKNYANDGTFTSVESNGASHQGTYTFTQYSPTMAVIQGNYTGDELGAIEYIELDFTATTGGRGYGCYYGSPACGSNPDDTGAGKFTIK